MPYLDKDFKPTIFEYTNVNDYNRLLVYYPAKAKRRGETPTPSPTLSPTPSTTLPETCHIEAQNGDLLIAQNGDYIDHFPCIEPSPTPSITPTSTITPTPSITPTITPTNTQTPTPSITPSASVPAGDPDANAYLADVVASGGTTNPTIESAVDTLFTSLKSAGLYSKMLAMYPYVGSTAASHSINALLNKSYDITWFGGMTHGISGSTGDGINGYGNTNFGNLTFAQDDVSVGYYQNTANPRARTEEISMGRSLNNSVNLPEIQIGNQIFDDYWMRLGTNAAVSVSNGGNIEGNYIATRTGTTTSVLYRNATQVLTGTNTYTKGGTDYDIYVFNFNQNNAPYSNGYANQTFAFTFMAEALSSSEVSTLDNIINTFQTSLGRNTY